MLLSEHKFQQQQQQQQQRDCRSCCRTILSNYLGSSSHSLSYSFGKQVKPQRAIGILVISFLQDHIFYILTIIIFVNRSFFFYNFRQRFLGLPNIMMWKITVSYILIFVRQLVTFQTTSRNNCDI
jgi:hypothetical protein